MSVLSSLLRSDDDISVSTAVPLARPVSSALSSAVLDARILTIILSYTTIKDKFIRCVSLNHTFDRAVHSSESFNGNAVTLTPSFLDFIRSRRPQYFDRIVRVDRVDNELDDGDESTFEYDYSTVGDLFPFAQSLEYRQCYSPNVPLHEARISIERFAASHRALNTAIVTIADEWDFHLFQIITQSSPRMFDVVVMILWRQCRAQDIVAALVSSHHLERLTVYTDTETFIFDFVHVLALAYRHGRLAKLQRLELLHPEEHGSLAEMSAIATLQKIRIVDVNWRDLPSLTSFPLLSNLSRVIMRSVREIEELSTLHRLTELTIILNNDCRRDGNINSLIRLERLQVLTIGEEEENTELDILKPLLLHTRTAQASLWTSLHSLLLSQLLMADDTMRQLVIALPYLITMDIKAITGLTILSIYHISRFNHLMLLSVHDCTGIQLKEESLLIAQQHATIIYGCDSRTLRFLALRSFCWSGNVYNNDNNTNDNNNDNNNNNNNNNNNSIAEMFLSIYPLFNPELIQHFHIEFHEKYHNSDIKNLSEIFHFEFIYYHIFQIYHIYVQY